MKLCSFRIVIHVCSDSHKTFVMLNLLLQVDCCVLRKVRDLKFSVSSNWTSMTEFSELGNGSQKVPSDRALNAA